MKNIVLLVFLVSAFGFGQDLSGGFDQVAGNDRSWQDMQIGTVFKEIPIVGSPYLDEMYKMGVATVNGRKVSLLMRYDAFNDQIEMIDKYQKSFNLLKKKDIDATFNGKVYKIIEYTEKGKKKLGYANPLNEGVVVLYFKPRKIFRQAEKPDHGYDVFDPPKYQDDHAYFIQRNNGAIQEIRLNKKQLLKFMQDRAPALQAYISKQNLDLRTEAHAVQLMKFYNAL